MFWKLAWFLSSGKKAPKWWPLRSLATIETVYVLTHAPKNGSSPRVVAVKRLLKN